MKNMRKHLIVSMLAVLGSLPQAATAESNSDTTAPYSAAAKLNLKVVIPQFLYFRVGTTGAVTDTITFAPTPIQLGDPLQPVSGTGGDTASGSGASVVVRGNGGQITITEANNGGGNGFSDGGTQNISLTEISVDDSANASLPAPTLSDGGGGTSKPTLNPGASQVTNQTNTWIYSYDNTTVPGAGTYDIQLTYTASMP